MALTHKPATPKALAANRENALLSTGPRSAEGKFNTGRNRLEHGIFAQAFEASIQELGENPADYESLRRGLLHSFAPEDGFEAMLVEEMAQIAWRRQRLMRAESGIVAAKKRNYEIERALSGSSHAGGAMQFANTSIIPALGFAGLPDSVDKCDRILHHLRNLKKLVSGLGFRQDFQKALDSVYGQVGPLAGVDLKARFQKGRELAKSGKREERDFALDNFLAALGKEIKAYQELRKLCQARDLETTQTMKDAQLLPSAEDLGKILRYEATLARQFKSKLKQLVAWRRAKKGMAPYEPPEPEAEAEELTPEPEREPEGNTVACLEGSVDRD